MEQVSIGKLSDPTMKELLGAVDSKAWLEKVKAGMKSKFKNELQYSKYAANRLIRTESAYVSGQAVGAVYDECGVEEYEFIATLDNRTSQKCAGLDGQIFKKADAEVGVNWPPLHPMCRSSTVSVIDGKVTDGLKRAARDKNGKTVKVPRSMKYQQWVAWQKDGCPDIESWLKK
jgi:SPP1 gp7 family putative phage head morphogenesis protein